MKKINKIIFILLAILSCFIFCNPKANASDNKITKIQDPKLKSTTNDIVSISTDFLTNEKVILLDNGELWQVNDETLEFKKKIDENVKKFVSYYLPKKYEAILYKDNTLLLKTSKWSTIKKNILDIEDFGYITSDKLFYKIIYSSGKKLKYEKKLKNVDSFAGYHIVIKNGKLWSDEKIKISNEKILKVSGTDSSGIFINKDNVGFRYEIKYGTSQNKPNTYKVKKMEDDVVDVYPDGVTYKIKNGTFKYSYNQTVSSPPAYELDDGESINFMYRYDNKTVYYKGKPIFKNIIYLGSVKYGNPYIWKKDGSLWIINTDGTLNNARSGKNKYKKVSKPTSLKVKQLTTSKVKLTWKDVKGVKGYTIYRSTSKNGDYEKIGTSKTNSYKDKSIKQWKTYYYKIVANMDNKLYDSNKSSFVKIKTK